MQNQEKLKILKSLKHPILFLIIIWIIKIIESYFRINFGEFGIKPRTIDGLPGILLYPFIHGDWKHLINNSISYFILSFSLYYFYDKIASKIWFWIYVLSGIWLWCLGRPNYHIGASGIIYGLAAFLFFSGIFRKNKSLSIISLLVVFVYGSMVWGVLPIDYTISFEGHFTGAISGLILSFFYKNEGPENDNYELPDEDYPIEFWKVEENNQDIPVKNSENE